MAKMHEAEEILSEHQRPAQTDMRPVGTGKISHYILDRYTEEV